MNVHGSRAFAGIVEKNRRSYRFVSPTITSLAFAAVILVLLALHCPAAFGQANVQGKWQTLSSQMPINPIHIALLHTGKILVVPGSGNDGTQTTYRWGLWDYKTNTMTTSGTYSWDMFCNAMVTLPDGRAFIVGG